MIWKLRDRPSRLIRCGGRPSMPLAVQPDLAGGDRKAAADQVEQRGLAGAVRADDRVALAARDVEADAADDLGRAETLASRRCRLSGGRRSCRRARAARVRHQAVPDAVEGARLDAAARRRRPAAGRRRSAMASALCDVDRVAEQHEVSCPAPRRSSGTTAARPGRQSRAARSAARATRSRDRARTSRRSRPARAIGACARTMPVRPVGAKITMAMNSTPT